jgi:hypothetical protein
LAATTEGAEVQQGSLSFRRRQQTDEIAGQCATRKESGLRLFSLLIGQSRWRHGIVCTKGQQRDHRAQSPSV